MQETGDMQGAILVETAQEAVIHLPEWVPQPVVDLWMWCETYPWVAFLVLIVLSIVAAKITEWIFERVFKRLAGKTDTTFDEALLSLLQHPVFHTVLFLGLASSVRFLDLPAGVAGVLIAFLKTVLLAVWLKALRGIARVVLDMTASWSDRVQIIEERTLPLFHMLANLAILGGGIWVFLQIWGIDATAWLASAGVAGIAIGFAARDTLSNLFSGVFIVADAPYKLGDYVNLDSGERGKITHVGLRSTRMLTRDDVEITVPNAVMANAKIINESGGPWEKYRIRIPVGAAYGSDVDQVVEVLERIAVEHEGVCASPAPRVRFRAFGASSLDFELLCWIEKPEQRGLRKHELHMEIYKVFDREGIEIPYSKHDVYIKEMPVAGD